MSGVDLERELVDLGDHLDVPEAPLLAARVVRAVTARPARARSVRRRLAVALGVVLVAGASPAVADWLGVTGVEVRQEAPPVTAPAGRGLDLGTPSTLGDAGEVAGFEVRLPGVLGPPDGVWVDTRNAVPMVHLVWERPRVLLTQFRAGLAEDLMLTKWAGAGVRVDRQPVGGVPGLWVEGTHEVAFARGDVVLLERLRLSDSALLWERAPLTFRLETAAGRAEAVRIAGSVREP